jgi:hypothetical protein
VDDGKMSELFENAVTSITLGIEDYQSNDKRRPASAVRNFYAGVLLLGKQCLINAAPEADPMEVLASKFVPVPDEEGGVEHEPKGYQTIDLGELRERFNKFGLKWPGGEIKGLQKLRNDFEHYHSPAPKESIQQAIAECFPLVEGFFKILSEDPSTSLGMAWDIMLAEEAFFAKQKAECDATFEKLPWGGSFTNSEDFGCDNCGSSLIYQDDSDNADPSSIEGKCRACGGTMSAETTVAMIVQAEHGVDDYIQVKDGGDPAIHDCNECSLHTYVETGDYVGCYFCDYSIDEDCARCGTGLTATTQSVNNPALCDYCDHMTDKVMRE